ncbi:MAG: hypothetical protein JXA67_17165, partial [Micromonosporaceae bacterium]|nr:hypothetical protein [Micromonosporaceae bacterium]
VDEAARRQGPVRRIVASVAARTGATVLDSWDALCPDATCTTQADGFIRYRDALHLSVPQSLALAPDFRNAIVAAG